MVCQKEDLEKWTDYKLEKELGVGAYSTVWEAIHKPTGKRVAIKKQVDIFSNIVDCKRRLREVMILRKMNHPNIVRLLDFFVDPNKELFSSIYLVLEFADACLGDIIASPIYLSEGQLKKILYHILLAFKYIESAGVLHRDLKPSNVLINEDCSAKICDFGLSRCEIEISCPLLLHKKKRKNQLAGNSPRGNSKERVKASPREEQKEVKPARKPLQRKLTLHVVTRWYRPPEVILMQKDYGHAVDIWGAGCVFAELLSLKKENVPKYFDRRPIFPGGACYPLSPSAGLEEAEEQLNVILNVIGTPSEEDCHFIGDQDIIEGLLEIPKIKSVNYGRIFPGSGKEAIDLLAKMLHFNPYKRLTIDGCLNHPYLATIRKKEKEIVASEQIDMDFEDEGKLDEPMLRKLFLAEADYYAKKKAEGKLEF